MKQAMQGLALACVILFVTIRSCSAAGTTCVTFTSTACGSTLKKDTRFDQFLSYALIDKKNKKEPDDLPKCFLQSSQTLKKLPTGCFTAADGPYKGQCCCPGPKATLTYCVSLRDRFEAFEASGATKGWTDEFATVSSSGGFKITVPKSTTLTPSSTTLDPNPNVDVDALLKNVVDKTKYIELDPLMSLFPPAQHEKVFIFRLEKLSKSVYPEVQHQAQVLHDVLTEGILVNNQKKKSFSWTLRLLEALSVCIANLHAADETRKFLDNGEKLVPLHSAVGDHFFADSIIEHIKSIGDAKRNMFNAFKYNPHQILGQEDPHQAVNFLKTASSYFKASDAIVELLIRSLALDMSAWARLYSPEMRVNAKLQDSDVANVYKHLQNEITTNLDALKTALNFK